MSMTPAGGESARIQEASRVSPADRRLVVAWSPDGAHLAAVEGTALVVYAGDDEVLRHPLVDLEVAAISFAGPDHLAVLATSTTPGAAVQLWSHAAPDWAAGPSKSLRRMTPTVAIGHAEDARVLVAPRPGTEWDASGQASKHRMGAVVYSLSDGAPIAAGGVGTYSDPKSAWSLAWDDDAVVWAGQGKLHRAAPGESAQTEPLSDSRPVAQLAGSPTGLLLAQASPPRVGPAAGPLEVVGEGTLIQLLTSPAGDTVAVVVQEDGDGLTAAAVGVSGAAAGSSVQLPWPLSAAALHPSRPELAIVADGQLSRLTLSP